MTATSAPPTSALDDTRREIARQLRITHAVFPSVRLTEDSVTAYCEALEHFPADTIAEAFRIARQDAERNQAHHPRPAEIRRYASMRTRQVRAEQPHAPDVEKPYCSRCGTRTLYDDGSDFGRFAIAHSQECPFGAVLPAGSRLWHQGKTPSSFDQRKPEIVAALNAMCPNPRRTTSSDAPLSGEPTFDDMTHSFSTHCREAYESDRT